MSGTARKRTVAENAVGVKAVVVAPRAFLARVIGRKASFADFYRAPQVDRITMVKEGVPSSIVGMLVSDLAMPKERFYGMIGVARATVDRKVKAQQRLDRAESEGVLGMARLIGQVQHIVQVSGNSIGFDAGRWVSDWLQHPLPALGGHCPSEYMDTEEGRALVSGLIAQMQSGAYA